MLGIEGFSVPTTISHAILRKAPWVIWPYMAAIQDIESLPARSCDMDTSQIYSSFSGGGSLDKPLIHGKTSSKFRAASIHCPWGSMKQRSMRHSQATFFPCHFLYEHFACCSNTMYIITKLQGVDGNVVDSQVIATIVYSWMLAHPIHWPKTWGTLWPNLVWAS